MRAIQVVALVMYMLMLMLTEATWGQGGEEEVELKKRFEERYLTLVRLKDQGKVGETYAGFAEVVESRYLVELVNPRDSKSVSIIRFFEEENGDRRKLYRLIARRSSTDEGLVATRNAKRLFSKARPNHFLKLSDGRWVQLKDLQVKARQASKGESRASP